MKKAAVRAAFFFPRERGLLAAMPTAVFALEPGAGRADKAVALGIALGPAVVVGAVIVSVGATGAERSGGNRVRRPDRAADEAGRDVARRDTGVRSIPAIVVPAVMPAVVPLIIPAVVVGIALAVSLAAILRLTLIAAGIGISGSLVLAIGVRIELRAVTRIGNDLLGHRRARQRGGDDRSSAKNRQFRDCQSRHGGSLSVTGSKRCHGRMFRSFWTSIDANGRDAPDC